MKPRADLVCRRLFGYRAGISKTDSIVLPDGTRVEILYEDRSVLAIDKPAGWMLAPTHWDKCSRDLQRALVNSLEAGEHWARCRNLRYIRFIHRLDADTSGVLLLARNHGVLRAMSRLFENRQVRKKYLALVRGVPAQRQWTCRSKLSQKPDALGRMRVDSRHGREAETEFVVLQKGQGSALIEAEPRTGRTHQIRVHLAEAGHPVVGDALYGDGGPTLALRAVELSYDDPFQKRPVRILAPRDEFLRRARQFLGVG
jgi:23S rRNA pseudouridine1911/1915/1917 synthase